MTVNEAILEARLLSPLTEIDIDYAFSRIKELENELFSAEIKSKNDVLSAPFEYCTIYPLYVKACFDASLGAPEYEQSRELFEENCARMRRFLAKKAEYKPRKWRGGIR